MYNKEPFINHHLFVSLPPSSAHLSLRPIISFSLAHCPCRPLFQDLPDLRPRQAQPLHRLPTMELRSEAISRVVSGPGRIMINCRDADPSSWPSLQKRKPRSTLWNTWPAHGNASSALLYPGRGARAIPYSDLPVVHQNS